MVFSLVYCCVALFFLETHNSNFNWLEYVKRKKRTFVNKELSNEGYRRFNSTVPKKNAGRSISFLPTSCPYRESHYIYVGKKEYSISATNKHCVGRKYFGFKAALLLVPKRDQ